MLYKKAIKALFFSLSVIAAIGSAQAATEGVDAEVDDNYAALLTDAIVNANEAIKLANQRLAKSSLHKELRISWCTCANAPVKLRYQHVIGLARWCAKNLSRDTMFYHLEHGAGDLKQLILFSHCLAALGFKQVTFVATDAEYGRVLISPAIPKFNLAMNSLRDTHQKNLTPLTFKIESAPFFRDIPHCIRERFIGHDNIKYSTISMVDPSGSMSFDPASERPDIVPKAENRFEGALPFTSDPFIAVSINEDANDGANAPIIMNGKADGYDTTIGDEFISRILASDDANTDSPTAGGGAGASAGPAEPV